MLLGVVNIYDKKCINNHICQIFLRVLPQGRSYLAALIDDIDRSRAWLIPKKMFLPYKTKETVSKCVGITNLCPFCGYEETLTRLFFSCKLVQKFWFDLWAHLNKIFIFAIIFKFEGIFVIILNLSTNLKNTFSFFHFVWQIFYT